MSEQVSPTASPSPVKTTRPTTLHPAAVIVRDQPLFTVDQLTVAGDGESLNGKMFVGTGADDLSDLQDRRVEFKIGACAS